MKNFGAAIENDIDIDNPLLFSKFSNFFTSNLTDLVSKLLD